MDANLKEQLIESIKACLEDEKNPVRRTAVRALSLIDETVEVSIPLLVDTAIEGDKLERVKACENLVAVGEKAIPLVIEKLVDHPDDQDARLQGISILMSIYEADKHEQKHTCGHDNEDDPHGLGPLMKRAFRSVLEETLKSFTGQENDTKMADGN